MMGIQKGYQTAKREVTQLMQDRLNQLNEQNSEKIIQMRGDLAAELPELDDSFNLEAPSLQEGIATAHQSYGVLASGEDQAALPDDLQSALEA